MTTQQKLEQYLAVAAPAHQHMRMDRPPACIQEACRQPAPTGATTADASAAIALQRGTHDALPRLDATAAHSRRWLPAPHNVAAAGRWQPTWL